MTPLHIANNSQKITFTNFWETSYNLLGVSFLSINAGAARLLLADRHRSYLQDIRNAQYAVLSRGPCTPQCDSCELFFEDHSDAPLQINFTSETMDRLLPKEEAGSDFPLLVYVSGGRMPDHVMAVRFQCVPLLPWLQPIKTPPKVNQGILQALQSI